MKSTQALRRLGLAGLGSLLAASASAQEGGYYYGGLSIGQSRAKIDEERLTANLLGAGLTTTGMQKDEKDTAYKLFGGYQVNRNLALEAGYFNLGKFSFSSTTVPAGTLDGRIKLQGLNLDLVGTLPLTGRLSALGRFGVQVAQARDTFSSTGAVAVADPNPSKTAANYKLGAGLQYAFGPSWLVRAEAERYRINDAVGNRGDVNMLSVSLVLPFGRSPEPAPRAAVVEPAYVPPVLVEAPPAPVAAAEPSVATAPVAPVMVRHRVTYSAESLFTFDESELRPEGKAALDTFAKDLQGARFEMISVEGYTDRIGSEAYNRALSQRRADAVKAYLVTSGRVGADKITAQGQSESAPVTQREDCKGNIPSAKLIACLQPDRRVEIEVVGTRAGQ